MFGVTLERLRELSLITNFEDPVDLTLLAESYLSDVQEMMALAIEACGRVSSGETELIRQLLNRAKYLSSEARRIVREEERKR